MALKQYPYIPNTSQAARQEMLDFIGVKSVEDIYSFIPSEVRTPGPLDLPEPFESEMELKKHVDGILNLNNTCTEYISFLGAGCYNHYVPAVCDEINGRSEFLTAYSGDTYGDHGKCQTFFEFTSMMGELLNMDVVGFPTYDGGQAAGTSILMSRRMNGRNEAIVPENMNPSLLSQLKCYCDGMDLIQVKAGQDGQLDLEDLKKKCSIKTSCVFIQNPCFLGFFEEQGEAIGQIAHSVGAEYIVYADPSTLGVVAPPADYGADIVCGDIQPLGIHMSYGGGLGGYLATRQEERYVMNYPHHLYSIFKNSKGQFGYARALPERTSYYQREKAVEFLGTCVGLWAVTAAVYLAVMGPKGMEELGENILYKSSYAQKRLSEIPGLSMPYRGSKSFMEFVVTIDSGDMTVADMNRELLDRKFFGGYDLSRVMPQMGQSMLVCVTEKTEFSEIDALADSIKDILQGGKRRV